MTSPTDQLSALDGLPPAMRRNFMAELGDQLVDCGYRIIPIWPGAKCPGRYQTTRGWQAYPDWPRHAERTTKPFELSVWKGWPGCGVGVACGNVGGLDLDILDAEVVAEIEALARAELGDTEAWRVGRAPKKLLVYRQATPFPKMPRHPLEWLGHGSQFVAYGVHPDTQEPYRWPAEELCEIRTDRLPVVTHEQVARFLDRASALVPPELRVSRLGPDRSAEHYFARHGDLRGTREATAEALAHIPNDDLPYDDWIALGYAIKGSLGEDGHDLWLDWSASSKKNDPKATEKAWRSFKDPHKGFGSLYYYASQHGWAPDPLLIFNAAAAEATATVDLSGFTAKTVELPPHDPETGEVEEAAPAEPNGKTEPLTENEVKVADGIRGEPVPDEILQPGGLLQEIIEWMTETAIYPHPFLYLASALCTIGVAAGRRYAGPTDLRTNIYCITIADSSSGKEHAIGAASNLLNAAEMVNYLAGEDISSGAAVESTLAAHATQLFQLDELGHFMAAVMNNRANTHHKRDVLTKFTKITGQAQRLMKGTEYANKKERNRVDIWEPCACIYGTTVPHVFWNSLTSSSMSDGSMPRMLFFQTPMNFPDARHPKKFASDVPQHLANGLRKVVAQSAWASEVGFAAALGLALNSQIKPTPIRVDYADASAVRLAEELTREQDALKLKHEGSKDLGAVWGRWREHVFRLALLHAISADPIKPAISTASLTWARKLADHCLNTLVKGIQRHVADTEHEAKLKKVLEIVRRHGTWMDGNTLSRKTQFLNRKDRNELVAQLEESGDLEFAREAGTTKPRNLIRARR